VISYHLERNTFLAQNVRRGKEVSCLHCQLTVLFAEGDLLLIPSILLTLRTWQAHFIFSVFGSSSSSRTASNNAFPRMFMRSTEFFSMLNCINNSAINNI
jgi:hypothetical protein